jgi:hypothetical protein
MSEKMFTVAGIVLRPERDNGMTKVRFSRDVGRRVKALMREGATRCDLVELPTEMNKVDALKYLMALPQFANPADQAILAETLDNRTPSAPRKPRAAKAAPSLEQIKSRAKRATTSAQDVLAAVSTTATTEPEVV